MLSSLSIRNIATIERLEVEFEPGLNVLTGETGAGKSILIGALNLLLGARADTGLVRSGADRASVDAVFDLEQSPHTLQLASELGFETEGTQLILSRELSAGGKSAARIGGRPATVAQLRELGELLVDLHGQHEHQSLLSVSRHIVLLDDWGGEEIADLKAACAGSWDLLRRLRSEAEQLAAAASARTDLLELLAFQVEEIDRANIHPDEYGQLQNELERLKHVLRLKSWAVEAAQALRSEAGEGALDLLASAQRSLTDAAAIDSRLAATAEAVGSALYTLEEAARDLARYADSLEEDPERLEEVTRRIDLLNGLMRKYGETPEDVLSFGEAARARLQQLQNADHRRTEIEADLRRAETAYQADADRLTTARQSLARRFSEQVSAELEGLAMSRCRFETAVEQGQDGPAGRDRVEFLLAPNPGEPLRPLARIASGGEISRVMLAIKSTLARREALPTMVFDEIDVGVGGRTAGFIAERMEQLARTTQIVCITHLPQIAGRGSHHLRIEKRVEGERTLTTVVPLASEERVEEIARMLGSVTVTEGVRTAARELLGFG
jgi:DNA repair protein RecN (Recombination protein N)